MSWAIRGHHAAQIAASDPVVWLLAALLVALALCSGTGAHDAAIRFEAYGHLTDAEAAEVVDARLNGLFRAGSRLLYVRSHLEGSGARCRELRQHPGFVYCTYSHAAPGLSSYYLRMEWKVLLWYDGARERFALAEVHRNSVAF